MADDAQHQSEDEEPTGTEPLDSISVRYDLDNEELTVFYEWARGAREESMTLSDAAAVMSLFRTAEAAYFDYDTGCICFDAKRKNGE